MARRREHHTQINDLYDRHQKDHSTETILIKVQGVIPDCMEEGSMAVLVLIELSAAFEMDFQR